VVPAAKAPVRLIAPPIFRAALQPPQAKFGQVLVATDIFFLFSRFPELAILTLGFFPPMGVLVGRVVALILAFLSGGVVRTFSRIGFMWLLFTVWFCLAIPFSTWPGGSVHTLAYGWLPAVLVYFNVAGLIDSTRQLTRLLYLLGVSAVVITLSSSILSAAGGEDRLALVAGTLSNANDMSVLLLAGIPGLLLFLQLNPGPQKMLKKAAVLVSIPVVFALVVKSGSRGAVLTIVLYWVLWFLHANVQNKLKLVVSAVVAMAVLLAFAPAASLARYRTLLPFNSASSDAQSAEWQASAEGSTAARQQTLRQSIQLTLSNPLFGVGPGVFMSAAAADSQKKGLRPNWLVTHNSYTEISSEVGIPGFLLYYGAVLAGLVTLLRAWNAARRVPKLSQLSSIGFCLLTVTAGNLLEGAFGSYGYLPYFLFYVAVAEVYSRIVQREIQALKPEPSRVPPLAIRRQRQAVS
jgi:O-antigen ligase